jgi:uncharacterized membrane protein (UPF0127 family)
MTPRWLLLFALLAGGWTSLVDADESLDEAFQRDVLIIEASAHACYRFDIWLALARDQQRRGLMHVREMPATSGMLFVYETPDVHSMWMKNTFISLDIAFARADGSITNIETHTEPQSLRSIASVEAVNFVLELNAGTAERLSIDTESRLIWVPRADLGADQTATED